MTSTKDGPYRAKKRIPITARLCETKPEKRLRVYCTKLPGFFVSITPRGVATFYFRYWDDAQGKQVDHWIGDYHNTELDVDNARAQASILSGRVGKGEHITAAARQDKASAGKKVAEIITEYIEWMKEPVKKEDGEKRPRVESFDTIAGYLNRFALPRLGKMAAVGVDCDDIAKLQTDITKGVYGCKASLSSARNTRTAMSGMFKWAAEAGRRYVKTSPCVNLPKLDKEVKRKRVLTPAEIKTLWWGLDRPDLPCSRSIALCLKFELVTMLRSKEYMTSEPGEFHDLGTPNAHFRIPLKRVKKRRDIVAPLSDLAQAIIAEAIADEDQPYVFAGKNDGDHLDRGALPHAVTGYRDSTTKKVTRQGIADFLGMKHFTPHDLRRTAASLAAHLKIEDWKIAKCLDHKHDKGEEGVSDVTFTYVVGDRVPEKLEVMNAVAKGLREIIGKPPKALTLVA
jgi:integrase